MNGYSPHTMLNLASRLGWDVRYSFADDSTTLTKGEERKDFTTREEARRYLESMENQNG